MMREATGIQFRAEATEMVKVAHQWTMIQDARHGWRGDIMVKLGSESEVLQLVATLEGKSIKIADGGQIVIEVLPHISMVEEARNRRRTEDGGTIT
eukprot:602106-Heterocapsa_arctica.AAC.1